MTKFYLSLILVGFGTPVFTLIIHGIIESSRKGRP